MRASESCESTCESTIKSHSDAVVWLAILTNLNLVIIKFNGTFSQGKQLLKTCLSDLSFLAKVGTIYCINT